jgi:hypothetical protein
MLGLIDGKPVVTILTVAAALIAVIAGGVVTITNPQTLSFHQYVQDVAFMAGALGLGAGIGRGIDAHGRAPGVVEPTGEPVIVDVDEEAPPYDA